MSEIKCLEKMAFNMRCNVLKMAHDAGKKGALLGSALSAVEIYAVLYGEILKDDVDNPYWDNRDRFIAGKEHGRLAEYAALCEVGFLSESDLDNCSVDGNRLAGHQINVELGLEYSSCSLGMALPVAVGVALDAKRKQKVYKVYTLIGDGELDEGSVWEALMAASHYKLNNLIAIVDRNHLSSDGKTEDIMSLGNLKAKFEAFGWECEEIEDGNNIEQLIKGINSNKFVKPFVLVANTVKGKGVSYAENVAAWHRGIVTDKLYEDAISEIENVYGKGKNGAY